MPTETKPALPFAPYEGAEPYVFVSYAHANKDKVYPIIKRLHEMGYRLWWDEGIFVGDEWPKVIGDHLRKAACMLLFMTPEAAASQWVEKEVNVAVTDKIKIVGTFLDPTALSPSLYYQLSNVQMLFHEDEACWESLCKGIPKEALAETTFPVYGASPDGDFHCTYYFTNKTKVTTYLGKEAIVVIPSELHGCPVVEIGESAFAYNGKQIRTIIISKGISVIGAYAFSGCRNLSSIAIPKSVQKIRRSAFYLCPSLAAVTLPEGLKRINTETFKGCISLTDITIPASVMYIHKNAFCTIITPHHPNLTFHCPRGSYAEQYAKEHGIKVDYTT